MNKKIVGIVLIAIGVVAIVGMLAGGTFSGIGDENGAADIYQWSC